MAENIREVVREHRFESELRDLIAGAIVTDLLRFAAMLLSAWVVQDCANRGWMLPQASRSDDDQPVPFDPIEDAERESPEEQTPVAGVIGCTNLRELLQPTEGKIETTQKFFAFAVLKIFQPIVNMLDV